MEKFYTSKSESRNAQERVKGNGWYKKAMILLLGAGMSISGQTLDNRDVSTLSKSFDNIPVVGTISTAEAAKAKKAAKPKAPKQLSRLEREEQEARIRDERERREREQRIKQEEEIARNQQQHISYNDLRIAYEELEAKYRDAEGQFEKELRILHEEKYANIRDRRKQEFNKIRIQYEEAIAGYRMFRDDIDRWRNEHHGGNVFEVMRDIDTILEVLDRFNRFSSNTIQNPNKKDFLASYNDTLKLIQQLPEPQRKELLAQAKTKLLKSKDTETPEISKDDGNERLA